MPVASPRTRPDIGAHLDPATAAGQQWLAEPNVVRAKIALSLVWHAEVALVLGLAPVADLSALTAS
jgi:hypothetical protein